MTTEDGAKARSWEITKMAAYATAIVVLAVLGVTKYMETEEVLWMALAIPLVATIAAAV